MLLRKAAKRCLRRARLCGLCRHVWLELRCIAARLCRRVAIVVARMLLRWRRSALPLNRLAVRVPAVATLRWLRAIWQILMRGLSVTSMSRRRIVRLGDGLTPLVMSLRDRPCVWLTLRTVHR